MAQFKSRKFQVAKIMSGDGDAAYINDVAAVPATLAAADTIDFLLQKGYELSSLRIFHDQLDSSTGLTAKVGYAFINGETTVVANGAAVSADDAYFAATAAFGRTRTGFVCQFPPITFEVDVMLRITVVVVGSTRVAGNVTATMGGNMVGVR